MAAEKEFYKYVSDEELAAEKAKDAEVKKDCFAFHEGITGQGECTILTDLYCKKEKCGFYKTKEKFNEDLRKAEGRKRNE